MSDAAAVLLIGYGNPLRGDDALGPLLIEEVEQWKLAGVETRSVHQLTPELSLRLVEVRSVLFLDASAAARTVTLSPVQPAQTGTAAGHLLDPSGLLGLTRTAFGKAPPGWLLTMPAQNFEIGGGLSLLARSGMPVALRRVREWVETVAGVAVAAVALC